MGALPVPGNEGVDFVWLASGLAGKVAAFVTAGSGPIPSSALNFFVIAITDVEAALAELPVVSSAQMLVDSKRPDDFTDIAPRGFFYDWQDVHRTSKSATRAYEPICEPFEPIKSDVLPEELRQLMELTVLPVIICRPSSPGCLPDGHLRWSKG